MQININYGGYPGAGTGLSSSSMMIMMNQMMRIMMGFMSGMIGGHAPTMGMPSHPAFGGGSGGSAPGLGNFLGGNGGGSPSTSGSAPTANIGSLQGGTAFGKKLAVDAERNANGPGGYCFKWVSQALRRHGVSTSGASAYMAADQLAKNDKFKEVKVSPSDFKKLPPGAVVVWNKGPGHPHGHISIALGDGREASDKIRNQITNYGTSARVFIPK